MHAAHSSSKPAAAIHDFSACHLPYCLAAVIMLSLDYWVAETVMDSAAATMNISFFIPLPPLLLL